ncbi:MAG: DUF4430 domain-containing protein [Christensenellaceae bacterium]|nr:DUF4430 domain-containing protein [Christensenellaceae bacterium]
MKNPQNAKKNFLMAGLSLAMLALLLAAYTLLAPKLSPGAKTITVEIVHAQGASKTITCQTDAEYLAEPLLAQGVISGEQSALGLYITTVDGETADEALQQWWCITKGGEMTVTAVDTTPIADGDAFELTLKTGW